MLAYECRGQALASPHGAPVLHMRAAPHKHRRSVMRMIHNHNMTLGAECAWDYGFEYDAGVRDLANVTLINEPGECCAICADYLECTHWTWAANTCWLKRGTRNETSRIMCMKPDAKVVILSDYAHGCASGLAERIAMVKKNPKPVRLFCFVLVRPLPSDIALLWLQLPLFKRCDEYAVYSNTSDMFQLPSGIVRPVVVGSMETPYGPVFNALNTRVFMPAFFDAFTYVAKSSFDWVIKVGTEKLVVRLTVAASAASYYTMSVCSRLDAHKVDVDTLFSISRLREVLLDYNSKKSVLMCSKPLLRLQRYGYDHPRDMSEFRTCLDGPIEVFSAATAAAYAAESEPNGGEIIGWKRCTQSLSLSSTIIDVVGEDWWLDDCLTRELGNCGAACFSTCAYNASALSTDTFSLKTGTTRVFEPRLLTNSYQGPHQPSEHQEKARRARW